MRVSKQTPMTINQLKRKVKELELRNEELRASVGNEALHGWKPDTSIEEQYDWVSAWLYPLYAFLNQHVGPSTRNEVMTIATAIISQMSIHGKYGIKIPYDPQAIDMETYFKKQREYTQRNYDPCDICGENRITHQCHIVPKVEGGAYHKDNFFSLCPIHHHLFDHNRLNRDEWAVLSELINTKTQSAIVYFREVRERQQKEFWGNSL